MMRCFAPTLALTVAALCGAASAQVRVAEGSDAPIAVPSGQVVTLQDVIAEESGPDGATLRFRFTAPAIAAGGGIDAATAAEDISHLCDSYALPQAARFVPDAALIVISLSDSPVEFGVSAPDVVQYFDAFAIDGDRCRWELF